MYCGQPAIVALQTAGAAACVHRLAELLRYSVAAGAEPGDRGRLSRRLGCYEVVGGLRSWPGDAAVVPLPNEVGAVLLLLVHDLTRALRLFEHARAAEGPVAQVVAFGAMLATHRMVMPVDMIVEAFVRRHVTTLEGLRHHGATWLVSFPI